MMKSIETLSHFIKFLAKRIEIVRTTRYNFNLTFVYSISNHGGLEQILMKVSCTFSALPDVVSKIFQRAIFEKSILSTFHGGCSHIVYGNTSPITV